MKSSQDVFFYSHDVLEDITQSSGVLHGRKTQRKVRESVMASRSSDVRQSSETSQLP